jgi:hypothetical protein
MKSFFTPCFYTRSAQGEDKEHEKVTSISVAVKNAMKKKLGKVSVIPFVSLTELCLQFGQSGLSLDRKILKLCLLTAIQGMDSFPKFRKSAVEILLQIKFG